MHRRKKRDNRTPPRVLLGVGAGQRSACGWTGQKGALVGGRGDRERWWVDGATGSAGGWTGQQGALVRGDSAQGALVRGDWAERHAWVSERPAVGGCGTGWQLGQGGSWGRVGSWGGEVRTECNRPSPSSLQNTSSSHVPRPMIFSARTPTGVSATFGSSTRSWSNASEQTGRWRWTWRGRGGGERRLHALVHAWPVHMVWTHTVCSDCKLPERKQASATQRQAWAGRGGAETVKGDVKRRGGVGDGVKRRGGAGWCEGLGWCEADGWCEAEVLRGGGREGRCEGVV
eukprot:365447-Chlamydomonas_euryale.AAC.25